MRSLDSEYITKQVIYEQQKQYRKTPEGRMALAKAKRRYKLKKKIDQIQKAGGKDPECYCCKENSLGYLTVEDNCVICFNCKYGFPEDEVEEICQ